MGSVPWRYRRWRDDRRHPALNSSYYLSPGGSGLVWFFIFLVGVQLTFNFSWVSVGALCVARIRERILQKKQEEEHKPEIVTHGQELASLPSISVSSPV